MVRLKGLGYVFIFIYVIVSFFSGLFFYGQSKSECIEKNGFWEGFFLGCDVIEGRFGPADPPGFVTSQLKGLFWPYYLFFDTKDSELPTQPKIIRDIIEQYPYKLSLSEIESELTGEKFKETVMRCGGILQAFINGVSNQGTKIPEAGKRFVELSLLAMSIHKEELGRASQLSKLEVDDVAAGRVMDEFIKHEKSYTPWFKYKNMMLRNKNTAELRLNLALFDDEKQCLKLTDGI
jgi:hypothetical protein